jgi:hypothetical protein
MFRNLKNTILWSLVGVNVLIVFTVLGGWNGIISGFDGKSLLQNLQLAVKYSLIILGGSFVGSSGISIIVGAIALLLFRSRQIAKRTILWGLYFWMGGSIVSLLLLAMGLFNDPSSPSENENGFVIVFIFAFFIFIIAIGTLIGAIAGMISGYSSHRILQRSRN